nr:silent information regulator protein Sir2 [Candidatus Sigynarchaeota archaeon]
MKRHPDFTKLKKLKNHPGYQCLLIVITMLAVPLFYDWILDVGNEGAFIQPIASSRPLEFLNRGLVAMRTSGGVYLGWRLLPQDPSNVTFDVYRQNNSETPVKLNGPPVALYTDFNDTAAGTNMSGLRYWVNSSSGIQSEMVTVQNLLGTPYISIQIAGNYTPERVGFGDLDGDGSLDYVIKQRNTEDVDFSNGDGPSPSTYKIQAYLSNGTCLWENDLGWDIPLGSSSPFVVYDLDSDGCAEVAIKTGSGDHRDENGDVTTGPEFLSVWDGLTGVETDRVDWIPRWSEDKWQPQSLLGVAYLDGVSPYLVMVRGIYGYLKVEALRYRDHQLERMWYWESSHEFGIEYFGGGSHWIRSVDVDHDGRDEIIPGSCVIDDTGKGLWSTGFQHADSAWVGEIDPSRPGLEIYYGIQGEPTSKVEVDYGMCSVDAMTGKVVWAGNESTVHVHSQGLVSDIDGRYPGMECYNGEEWTGECWLHAANGTLLGNGSGILEYSFAPDAVFWDADPQREVIRSRHVYDYETGYMHFTHQGNLVAVADLLGDWREELIASMPGELRIYTTTIPATDRRVTLLNDSIYRLDVAHCSMGYWQVPMMSVCFAEASVPYDPSQPVVYNQGLNARIENAAFWMSVDCFLNDFLWEFIIYGSIIALISLIYLIAFLRRLALSRGIQHESELRTSEEKESKVS